jgi:branched-chain amino acid transport system substrate-binding protein
MDLLDSGLPAQMTGQSRSGSLALSERKGNRAMKRIPTLAALLLAGALIRPAALESRQAAAHTANDPGVSNNQILVGASLPESGPAGAYGVIGAAESAYFSYVNAHGGVYGRKLSLLVQDDGYDPSRTLVNVKNLVLSRNVFALLSVLGTANNQAVLPFITREKIPLVYPATGSSLMATPFQKYLFPIQVTYTVEGKVLTDYAAKTLHAKKIGVFYQNDDFGAEGLAAVKAQVQKDGVTLADSEPYQITDTDLSAQALKLKKAGVDAVIIFAIPQPAGTFIGTAARVGLKADLLSSSIAAQPALLQALGAAGNGIYFDNFAPLPDSLDPKVVLYRQVMKQYGTPTTTPIGPFTLAGYGAAQVFVEGLRRAGKNPTRAGLISALETFRNYTGSVYPKLTYTSTAHNGVQGAYVMISRNGAFKQVAPFEYPS